MKRNEVASYRVAPRNVEERGRKRGGGGKKEREGDRAMSAMKQRRTVVEAKAKDEDDEDEDEDDGDEDENDVKEIRQGEWADARRAGKQHRSSSRAFRGRDNSARYSAHAPVIHVLSRLLRPPRSLDALSSQPATSRSSWTVQSRLAARSVTNPNNGDIRGRSESPPRRSRPPFTARDPRDSIGGASERPSLMSMSKSRKTPWLREWPLFGRYQVPVRRVTVCVS